MQIPPSLAQLAACDKFQFEEEKLLSAASDVKPNYEPALTAASKRLQILVVDDSAVSLTGSAMTVRTLGYIAHEAISGQAALDILKVHSCAAILMDLQMPDMNGIECTRKIRTSETGSDSHIPIIGFSTMTEEDVIADCMNAGMDAYLTKGCSTEELAAVLKKFAGVPELAGHAA
jgi:two-component system sensor histidine kinase TorS